MKTMQRLVVLMVVALLLAACGSSRVVKREGSRSSAPARPAASAPRDGAYVVRAGDTLYGIAFRHGLDYREVADWNRIPAPYTIYPGQRLRLSAARTAAAPRSPSRGSVTGMPAPTPITRPGAAPVVSNSAGPAPVTPLPPETRPATAAPQPSVAATPASPVPATANAPSAAAPASSTPVVVPATPVVPAAVSAGGWRWPTQGQLIGRFVAGDPKRQGIDIAGTSGQAVVAAADGVVVYSGAGLVGYGELIIVKHSDEWLSAYAHSRKRLVTEGTPVRAGQTIAELGRSGTSRDMLHFEVRRNGKPVDPLTVLPPP
ncbi:MAG TPA: peptidoglycan DD-metalloendopeptidase family protein [Arenimonas sp.]|nr:peptidoglycan DD-metalloendopeptidase family protein [Arenimonas sp.]